MMSAEAPDPPVLQSSGTQTILVADDEPGIRRLIRLELSGEGFEIVTAEDGEQALAAARECRPDLALLDIVMPGMSGLELLPLLKSELHIPVILLTAKGTHEDRVRGLELGADDYIAKPFGLDDLTRRVRAVLARHATQPATGNVIQAGDLHIDLDRHLVRRGGEFVSLSRREWILLEHLAENAGRVLTDVELLDAVWGSGYRSEGDYLARWILRLRRKLESDPSNPRHILSAPGGYLLAAP